MDTIEEKKMMPFSNKTFTWGIVAAAIGCLPYIGAIGFIPAIVGIVNFKAANTFFRQNKSSYTANSIVKMWVGFYLAMTAFLLATIYTIALVVVFVAVFPEL